MEGFFEALIVANLPIILLFEGRHTVPSVDEHLSRLEQGILKDLVVDIRGNLRLLCLCNLGLAFVRLLELFAGMGCLCLAQALLIIRLCTSRLLCGKTIRCFV